MNNLVLITDVPCEETIFPDAINSHVNQFNSSFTKLHISEIEFEDITLNGNHVYNDWINKPRAKLTIVFQLDENAEVTIYSKEIIKTTKIGQLLVFPSIFYYQIIAKNSKLVLGNAYGKSNLK